jgi:hypothetical protein
MVTVSAVTFLLPDPQHRLAGAKLHEVPDAHNYTAWRDALDPHLSRLLSQVCP